MKTKSDSSSPFRVSLEAVRTMPAATDTVAEIPRAELLGIISNRLKNNPVVLLLGPRQCGKTTLARQFASAFSKKTREGVSFFDLENPAHQRRLSEPMTALEGLRGLVIIDEAQLQPALFPVLRVLADRKPPPARFLLLGSASPALIRGSSETLAGRVAHISMSGFSLDEVFAGNLSADAAQPELLRRLWLRGGFPNSYLAPDDETSRQWRDDFILAFVERDLRVFGVEVAPLAMRRFWNMAAHYHGQTWNASELAKSLGVAHTTVKRHLDILCEAFVMRQLPPWFENISKRQVKSPKVYLRDSGLLHNLLGVGGAFGALESHPKLGASWEGFALEEVLRVTGDRDAYFWATQSEAELDLMVQWRGRRLGFEFKYGDAPGLAKSMHIARATLKLERLFVIYPGSEAYPLPGGWAEVLPLAKVRGRLMNLGC